MTVLSDKKILTFLKNGEIIITPFNPDNLNNSSYDVTLGEWFYREHQPHSFGVHNMYDESSVRKVWSILEKAKPLKEWLSDKKVFRQYLVENARRLGLAPSDEALNQIINYDYIGINKNDKVIFLFPGETILTHTNEFIGGKTRVTTMMKARSSIGRNFVEVCKDAGWGDVGYFNRWTMEITNNSANQIIPLVVGSRVAQIVFIEVGEVNKVYNKIKDSKYQNTDDLEQLKKSWTPEMMIPKTWNKRK